MNKTKLLTMLMVISTSFTLYAQKDCRISGHVKDEEGKIIPQVTIALRSLKDSSLVKGTFSNESGYYALEDVDQMDYIIQFSHVNYHTTYKNIASSKNLIMEDVILFNNNSIKLGEVEVKSRKPLLIRSTDKLTLNIEESIYENGENGLRLLNIIPGVNATGKEIKFRGSEGVTIYIDNRRLQLSGDQLIAYLQNIPSESIKSYELKTVPGAENDAQNAGVIINIELKSEYKFGLSGNLNAGYWYNGYNNGNNSAMLNYRTGKLTFQAGGNYRNSPAFYEDDIVQQIKETGLNSRQKEKYTEKFDTYGYNFGIDYRLTEKQTLGANYTMFTNPGDRDNTTKTTTSFLQNDSPASVDSTQISKKRDNFYYKSQMANLFYRNKFDSLGSKLDLGYSLVKYYLDNPSTVETSFLNKDHIESGIRDSLFTHNIGNSYAHVFNIDLEKNFKNSLEFSVGAKYSISKTNYLMEYRKGLTDFSPLDSQMSNDFLYNEKILAFYTTISKSFKHWQFKAGLRAENTVYDGNSSSGDQKISNNRLDWFPSAYINRKLGDNHSLTFSYGRRINRPGFRQLNPFTFFTSANNIQEGNPKLLPYSSNNIQLEYLLKNKYSFTAGFQNTQNGIATRINNLDGLIISKDENISDNHNFFLSAYIPIKITKWWEFNINTTLRNTKIDVATLPEVHRSKFSQNLWATNRIYLPNKYFLEISGFYNRNGFYDFYDAHNVGKIDIYVKKSFFNDKLTTRLEIGDPFHLFKPGQDINTPTFVRNVYRNKIDFSRYVGVWFNYSFSSGKKSTYREYIDAGGNEVRGRL
ncbi:outer membrane beta-barrel family protein [Sphingobacterium sp. Mn56C]|uniref:outer membrane beta-barrel family protein n=1 Tax=Sphingobacterium sp. Mn56C TaxID=3395261 RepID=UPI003BC3ED09